MPGKTVEELLKNAFMEFCGCQYVSNNIHLELQHVGNIDAPLVEANFSFFDDIKEVNGYVLLSVPAVDQISFPNLRIIRGRQLIPHTPDIALAAGGKIQCLRMPLLTEISTGGVYFSDKGANEALCNVMDGSNARGYGVHWDDILNGADSSKIFMITGCAGLGKFSSNTAKMICAVVYTFIVAVRIC